ncbi:MAG: pyruvate kinase [Candidatus Omnitrophota bacterium]
MKKTKILCTVGPSSNSIETLTKMVESGMDAVRINTSHGDFGEYAQIVDNVRRVAGIPIVMDTQGPKIRLRTQHNFQVHAGDIITVGFSQNDECRLDADIYDHLQVGDRALIDDGVLEAFVTAKENRLIQFRFTNDGFITSGRAVNFPKKSLPLPPLTDKDVQTLHFIKENDICFAALSFTRNKEDIIACRRYLEGSGAQIIAKIENQEGVDNVDEIIEYADGVMIARGDMGVELEPEEIPIIQKRIIRKCNQTGKLVITATQMLQSMIENPRPTRAEVSDVANAILDGSGVVMLSGETAMGKYPLQSIRMMSRIAIYAERFVDIQEPPAIGAGTERAICDSIKSLCKTAGVKKIVSVTRRGHTAQLISRLRLQPEILALTSEKKTFKALHLYYGVRPVMYPDLKGSIRMIAAGMFLYEKGLLQDDDLVLFASGEYQPKEHKTNTIQIVPMRDLVDYCREHEC